MSLKNQRGAVAVMVALMLAFFIGVTAMAVDVGYLMASKNELQNVADAAALAAARRLGVFYEGMSYTQQQSYVVGGTDESLIQNAAIDVAFRNQAAGVNITVAVNDILIGTWVAARTPDPFTQTSNQPDAVRVFARRDVSVNNPVTLFFARIFGIESTPIVTVATAALTGQATAGPGGLPIPVGIARAWFENKEVFCDQPIRFYPTNSPEGCAGWHTYDDSPANASKLRRILDDLRLGRFQSPEVRAGQTNFVFIGGTLASAFSNMQELFDAMKTRNDGVIDLDNNSSTWTTSVVVYDRGDCSNPNTSIAIIGFATVVIYEVLGPPQNTINASVLCDFVDAGRGGGGNYGTLGSIPGLVQ